MALGLSLILMTAVLSAIELYRQVSTTGRSQVERAQLARAIMKKIETDIRACTFRLPEEAEEEEEQPADGDAETEVTLFDSTGTTEALAASGLGVVGDRQTLILHVARPTSRFETLTQATASPLGLGVGDGKSVAYFLAGTGGGGLQGMTAESLNADGTGGVAGLSRLEGDRLSLQHADATGNLEALVGMTQLLAAEVNVLEFRYFDGVAWYDVWDSAANESLPRAIEVVIAFRTDEASTSRSSLPGTDLPSNAYRMVVALPTADPTPVTSTLTTF